MPAPLNNTLLREVSEFIAEHMGLHFPEERWPDLARGLQNAGKELGFEYPDDTLSWLKTRELTAGQIDMLASHLTVGETYFFRDPTSFETLEREILPPIIARRAAAGRTLRLWSAGCCTGEEAYSLAIACTRAVPDIKAWNVSVLATDINSKFLAKAEAGIYSDWSFRGVPDLVCERYFVAAPDKNLVIVPTVKNLVHFGYLNLAEDSYPSLHNSTNATDVIFCRNVLMYFTPDHQRRVVAALHRCLVDGGCLLVNPAEASASLFPMFAMETFGQVTIYRKTSRPTCDVPATGVVGPEPIVTLREPEFVVAPVPVVPPIASCLVAAPTPQVPAAPVTPKVPPTTSSSRKDPMALAREHANQGRLEEALDACRVAIGAARTNPAAHFLYATICAELGNAEEAIATFRKVLYLDQDFILAHHALGGLYRRLGKQRQSKRHLTVALELLSKKSRDEAVPESDGMTCGRLAESVRSMTGA